MSCHYKLLPPPIKPFSGRDTVSQGSDRTAFHLPYTNTVVGEWESARCSSDGGVGGSRDELERHLEE